MLGAELSRSLGDAGMAVDWTRDGEDADEALAITAYDMILLDLGLPGRSGIELLRRLRGRRDATPVLIVTARDGLDARIAGLDAGADDYLVKPFAFEELAARIRAVGRRRAGHAANRIECGALTLDLGSHAARFHDAETVLPAREFALLQALAERPGVILSRGQLEEKLYGWDREVESNAVEVLIHYIRKRLGRDVIRNVRGAGWMVEKGPP